MKTIYQFLAFIVCLGIISCKKENATQVTLNYTVKVEHPIGYKTVAAANATVKATNSFTGETKTVQTDANGEAHFSNLLPGSYQFAASKTLAAQEANEQTGFDAEIFLNASLNNYAIQETGTVTLQLKGSAVGGWVIKQIYFSGAPNTTNFTNDQFYELYNNSSETLYADSICIGDIVGNPYLSSISKPSGFANDTEYVYFQNIFMVPGNGKTFPVAPGASFLIARTAINHKSDSKLGNPNSPVDLGTGIADAEVYYAESGRDIDNPDVPNMLIKHFGTATAFDWITTVYGPSIVIFKHGDVDNLPKSLEPNSTSTRTYPKLPVSAILDAIDCTSNGNVPQFKRLPANVDAGFQFVTKSYSGEALRRKVKTTINGRRVLQKTNNSSADFERVSVPTPKTW
ncbi:DUF4876 domain-containing protein [Sphingobacterium sp. Mn56C]|uniref:DUF4876 domain-containing protein n=1 Tax=Sphingobacterium sp. Mn56C TaxID=3395261 RepID=UPI003BC3EE56